MLYKTFGCGVFELLSRGHDRELLFSSSCQSLHARFVVASRQFYTTVCSILVNGCPAVNLSYVSFRRHVVGEQLKGSCFMSKSRLSKLRCLTRQFMVHGAPPREVMSLPVVVFGRWKNHYPSSVLSTFVTPSSSESTLYFDVSPPLCLHFIGFAFLRDALLSFHYSLPVYNAAI